MEFCR